MYTQNKQRYRRYFGAYRSLLLVVLVSITSFTIPLTARADTDEASASNLNPAKQTALGLYVTSKEAYEMWRSKPDEVTLIDVRTPEEFLFIGHAEMAWNIPLAEQSYQWDPEKKQLPMNLLPDFTTRVQSIAKPDDILLVTCRSGGRSAMAVNLLAKAGFKNVYNITDGVEGDAVKDPNSVFNGQRMVNGWKNSGLPWTYKIDPERRVLPVSK
jgi:rhodanese-related sulfurtransferase